MKLTTIFQVQLLHLIPLSILSFPQQNLRRIDDREETNQSFNNLNISKVSRRIHFADDHKEPKSSDMLVKAKLESAFFTTPWELSQQIDGAVLEEELGEDVSLSANGNIMAVSGNEGVFVYEKVDGVWGAAVPAGGDARNTIALSSDGTRLAIGYPFDDDNGSNSGKVEIKEKASDGSWTDISLPISGGAAGNLFGQSIALSADGNTLIIGSPGEEKAYVYEFSDVDGEYILSEEKSGPSGSGFGSAVAVSDAGDKYIIGAPTANNNQGFATIYEGTTETTFDGKAENDEFGDAVSLSSDGTTLSIGTSPGNFEDGQDYVQIYQQQAVGVWTEKGQELTGNSDAFGAAVSLSADGSLLAVGAPRSGENDVGSVTIYSYDSTTNLWSPVTDVLGGVDSSVNCGASIALSSDGETIAYGCPGSNDFEEGTVFVYVDATSDAPSLVPSLFLSAAPSLTPSISPIPSQSPIPSLMSPTAAVTISPIPSLAPSQSAMPSLQTSESPSKSDRDGIPTAVLLLGASAATVGIVGAATVGIAGVGAGFYFCDGGFGYLLYAIYEHLSYAGWYGFESLAYGFEYIMGGFEYVYWTIEYVFYYIFGCCFY